VNQLVIDVANDERRTEGGATVVSLNPEARRIYLWLHDGKSPTPRFIGELFLEQLEVEQLLSLRPLVDFAAGQMSLVVGFTGLVPVVPDHPKLGRAMKILKTVARMFGE